MADAHTEDHGHTTAAWTAVVVILVAVTVGAVAIMAALPWLFWVAVGLAVIGGLSGKVLQMMGLGKAEASA